MPRKAEQYHTKDYIYDFNPEENIRCPYCDECFSTELSEYLENEFKYKCDCCGKTFLLERHIEITYSSYQLRKED